MKTKKIILLIIAFISASVSLDVSAQAVASIDSSATQVTVNQNINQVQQPEHATSGVTYIQESFIKFLESTGFAGLNWQTVLMIIVACVLL